VISFQFSVEANMRPALYCAVGTNHTDPLSKSLSRFLNLFDQPNSIPLISTIRGSRTANCLSESRFKSRARRTWYCNSLAVPKKDEEKLPKFRIGRPATTFGDVCRDGSCSTPDLAGQSEQFLFCKEAGNRMQAQRQSGAFPPGEQLGEILHEGPCCEGVYCIYLGLNTDNCKLLRSGYVH
jgi:hypothetical protein